MYKSIVCLLTCAFIAGLTATASAQPPGDTQRLSVLEDRAKPAGRRIELAYVVLKSTAKQPGSPIVYLDGGPGGSGIGAYRIEEYRLLFEAMREIGDVVLLSQRGTGFSSPRLVCAAGAPAPADIYLSARRMTEVMTPRLAACAEEWRSKGVDLGAYNTEASADDLDDLRKALGAPKISLFGFSYGTHLALTAIRRHGGNIDRAILAGTEGPDDSQKYPHTYDLQLARLSHLEATSPGAPRTTLVEAMQSALSRLQRAPVQAGKFTIGREGFQYLLRRDIGDTNDTAAVIRLIRDTANGDYSLLAKFAERRFGGFGGGPALMPYAMDCASGISGDRLARINQEIPSGLLGEMTNFPFPSVCGALKLAELPDAFRAPVVSTVPTLFISGSLDSNTPPYQAEQVRWGFPNSTHVIVENAGHESTIVPDTQKLIVDFLKGQDVSGRRIAIASPLGK